MIVVVDSGVANLCSVVSALKRLGQNAEVTNDPQKIKKANHVILPGVGAAASAMRGIKERGLDVVLKQLGQPVLGICLGMQLLFETSTEGEKTEQGQTKCLDILAGQVDALLPAVGFPLPHMGWNTIKKIQHESPLLKGLNDNVYMYFVHSYAAGISQHSLASTTYGQTFSSIVGQNNFFGCQFHPERSGAAGAEILKNFLSL